MKRSLILSEFRRAGKAVALLEQIGSGDKAQYRVSISRRYTNLDKAKSAYLSEIPAQSHNYYKNQINENISSRDG